MIRTLHLEDVGPASELTLDLAPRLNVLTGDNGLGKTFLLDVAWWLLTNTWPGEVALPRSPPPAARLEPPGDGEGYGVPPARFGDHGWETPDGDGGGIHPRLGATLSRGVGVIARADTEIGGTFDWQHQTWTRDLSALPSSSPRASVAPVEQAPPRTAGLVIYMRADGAVAVWDELVLAGSSADHADAALLFTPEELWDGKLPAGDGRRRPPLCRGLIEDWRSWQMEKDPSFVLFQRALTSLSEPTEPLVPGEPVRVKISDDRKIPTLWTSYGQVPVTLASAGVKRVLGIAYLLVWAWQRHNEIAKLQNRRTLPCNMVVLLDEAELHLHPQWQRAIVPALLAAVGAIAPEAGVQVIATTHAPLVLASLEPIFDASVDALFTFDLDSHKDGRRVVVEKATWRRYGDASDWLTSHAFDLKSARSREAEEAILTATRALDTPELSREQARDLFRALRATLGDTDPFWMEWRRIARRWEMEP